MADGHEIDERVLVLAPLEGDAQQLRQVLHQAQLSYCVCQDMPDLLEGIEAGAGVVIVTEEALAHDSLQCLEERLQRQPPWSNLPLVFLISTDQDTSPLRLMAAERKLLVLQRPVQRTTLLTALNALLRARERQYELRDLLEKHRRLNDTLEERVAERTAALRQANEQLEREVAERQRLEQENLEVSTHERQWFAQELHDGLCQQLSTLSFMTASLQVRLKACPETSPEMLERVERITELAERSVREGRALARGLFPIELEEEGLAGALHSLATHTADAYQIDCDVRCDDELLVEDRLTATNLYRIAQEALSNAIRHGRARRITIALTVSDALYLRVEDDGAGIEAKPVGPDERTGIGLRTMRRRARAVGATLEIRPGDDDGTVVECRLPLDSRDAVLIEKTVSASS